VGRLSLLFLVGLAAVGSWLFFRDVPLDPNRWPEVSIHRPGDPQRSFPSQRFPVATTTPASISNPVATGRKLRIPRLLPQDRRFLRIATFNVGILERSKAENTVVLDRLATILAQFDIVALQDIAPAYSHVVGTLTDLVNASGEDYGFVLGPRVGRDTAQQQLAFVFDKRRVEIDEHVAVGASRGLVSCPTGRAG